MGNVHCFERRKLYSQATQKYVIASSNLNKQNHIGNNFIEIDLLIFVH
jgi:hypothetical protein